MDVLCKPNNRPYFKFHLKSKFSSFLFKTTYRGSLDLKSFHSSVVVFVFQFIIF